MSGSDDPWVSVLELTQFKIFVIYMDIFTECSLSKFVDDTSYAV